MSNLATSYTSTGAKFFAHEEAMRKLQNGRGQPIVTHLMPTDRCQHTCAFCSVQTRAGDVLALEDMVSYLAILRGYGLKAVIISGGGNPILYRHQGATFDNLVQAIHEMGLEIGLITNGMPLREVNGRKTWKGVDPASLDLCTWIRISMAGLDHEEREVYIPDIDPHTTRLGLSYVYHDIYIDPAEKNHGKVSRPDDLVSESAAYFPGSARIPELTQRIGEAVKRYSPAYVRLLPNCLEPSKIPARCADLQKMADVIDPGVVFVQYKPPSAPKACFLGYVHPVLNSDGYVYPCDSCVLNESADHKFASPWRVCHWSDVAKIYDAPVRSLIADPATLCPGCVFPESNRVLGEVVDGTAVWPDQVGDLDHANFV